MKTRTFYFSALCFVFLIPITINSNGTTGCWTYYQWCSNLAEELFLSDAQGGSNSAADSYVDAISDCIDELDNCIN